MYNLVLNELEKTLKKYDINQYNLYTKISFLYEFLNKKTDKNFKLEILDIFYNLKNMNNSSLDIETFLRTHYKDKSINILFIYLWYKILNKNYNEQTIFQKIETDYKNSSEYRTFKLNLPKINEVIELQDIAFDEIVNNSNQILSNKIEFTSNEFFDFVELEYNSICQKIEVYNSTNEIIVRICIEGSLFYSHNNSSEHVLLKKGDVFIVNQSILNDATFLTEQCKLLIFKIKSPFILKILNTKFKKNSISLITLYRIELLLNDYESTEKDIFLLKILSNILNHQHVESTVDSFYCCDSQFNEIIKYIDNNIDKGLTVKTLEKKYKVYNKILNDKFKKYLNILPSEYLLEQKLLRAALILKTTNYKINYISDTLSFTSANNFTVSFKNKFGLTPLKYRNKYL
ncbi:helix-turn-helix transcriptional regulator [Cetobacterium sp. ZOR0034]|uniref:helix-turn-helix transcriptional regulator n=1 Tax=Cetobacterium sp. ZOR0034 TaxID=1339239 RepID=UPI0006454EAF|nr:AraC family transcriptional regulator [Cetobacterium sp. ZOR0034]